MLDPVDEQPSHLPVQMLLAMARLEALDQYRTELERENFNFNLTLSALLIGRHLQPQLDVDCCMRRLRQLADRARSKFAELHVTGASHTYASKSPSALPITRSSTNSAAWSSSQQPALAVIAAINHVLFEEDGFRTDADDPHNPRNAYLSEVLDRKCGSPLALLIIYHCLAQQLGLMLVPRGSWDRVLLHVCSSAVGCGDGNGDGDNGGERWILVDPAAGGQIYSHEAGVMLGSASGGRDSTHTIGGGCSSSGGGGDGGGSDASAPNSNRPAAAAPGVSGFGCAPSLELPGLPEGMMADSTSAAPVGAGGAAGGGAAGAAVLALGVADVEALGGLAPLPPRQLLTQLLSGLKVTYLMSQRLEDALEIIRYMRATQPRNLGDLRDEGLVLYALGRLEEARQLLLTFTTIANEQLSHAAGVDGAAGGAAGGEVWGVGQGAGGGVDGGRQVLWGQLAEDVAVVSGVLRKLQLRLDRAGQAGGGIQ